MLYKIEDIQPALSELIRPVYVIVLALALLLTWKWFRARAVYAAMAFFTPVSCSLTQVSDLV